MRGSWRRNPPGCPERHRLTLVRVVVPAVGKLNWAEELEQWRDELEPGAIHVVRGRADVQAWRAARVKVVIATYGLFTATSAVAGALP